MIDYNKTITTGRLTHDPALHTTPGGASVLTLSLAVNSEEKAPSGAWTPRVDYVDVVCFGSTAENTAQYCKKGSRVLVEGKLRYEPWIDKETGRKRGKHVIIADGVTFLGSPRNANDNVGAGHDLPASGGDVPPEVREVFQDAAPPVGEDDIPF